MMVIVPLISRSEISLLNAGAFFMKISAASSRLSNVCCQPRCEARRKRRSWSWLFASFAQSLLTMIALESVDTPAMSYRRVQPILTPVCSCMRGPWSMK